MTCHDLSIIGDEDRIGKAEPLDRARDLRNLLFRMRASIARIGAEVCDFPFNDLLSPHGRVPFCAADSS
jgi:hypothetical protein